MLENKRAMYTGAVMAQRTEVTLQWQKNGLFLVIYMALVTVLGGFLQRGNIQSSVLVITALAGMAVGILWLIVHWRAASWMLYWESRLKAIELSEPNPVVQGVFSGSEFERIRGHPLNAYYVQLALISSTIAAWFAALAYGIWNF